MTVGPIQLVLLGFATTERFRGDIARELLDLRGRGVIRVLDARLLHRATDGALTEVDLGELLVERPQEIGNPVARLLAANGGGNGNGRGTHAKLADTAGFAVEDVRRLTDEIGPGDYALAILVEHLWAARFREAVRAAGGHLLGQGFLTPEVVMVIGAEIQAHADAEAAIELANATRGAALLEALGTIARRRETSVEEAAHAAAEVVRALTAVGLVDESDAPAAIDALATAGLIELAVVEAARAEAEDLLGGHDR
ncbi:MAG TPA: hypothetical protein VFX51_05135 [Solirubrobacteraceae bacterium]|nr:hypothetical protein [Solirubrobacteraceae bacterium]